MSDTPSPKPGFSHSQMILAVAGAMIATVVTLHWHGKLNHTTDKSARPVGEFTAIYLEAGQQHRLSSKASELHAVCEEGFLVIASDGDPLMRGLLVDYKNRGVRCAMPREPAPTSALPPALSAPLPVQVPGPHGE
ncbi:MAG: kinase [Gammaproteobacteria bacterium]|nr:kinase [Gammaproteobacteria bacterium]